MRQFLLLPYINILNYKLHFTNTYIVTTVFYHTPPPRKLEVFSPGGTSYMYNRVEEMHDVNCNGNNNFHI